MDGRLPVKVGSLTLETPLIAASGTFSLEYGRLYDLSAWGGIVLKSVTPLPRKGHPAPRLVETPSGIMNAIGLENPGIDAFLRELWPAARAWNTHRVISVAGASGEDYVAVAARCEGLEGLSAIEINISCPNVSAGGWAFGNSLPVSAALLAGVKKVFRGPVWVKLPPEAPDLVGLARVLETGGAEAVVVANTYRAMAWDWRKNVSRLAPLTGGLSGPAIRPLSLRRVYEVSRAVAIPVIASGGASGGEDVLEYLAAGATAVELGTVNFVRPRAGEEVAEELARLWRERRRGEGEDLAARLGWK